MFRSSDFPDNIHLPAYFDCPFVYLAQYSFQCILQYEQCLVTPLQLEYFGQGSYIYDVWKKKKNRKFRDPPFPSTQKKQKQKKTFTDCLSVVLEQ